MILHIFKLDTGLKNCKALIGVILHKEILITCYNMTNQLLFFNMQPYFETMVAFCKTTWCQN
jgi:hypothetical protein